MKDEAEKIVVCPECGKEICVQVAVEDDIVFIRVEEMEE